MSKRLFLAIMVGNLDRSVAFFQALGFEFNPHFTDEKAACLIINDLCYVMLVIPKFYQGFTKKSIANAKITIESLISISLDSNHDVDRMVDQALSLGAIENVEPEDLGFMYTRTIEDFDGHQWSFFYMNPDSIPA